MPRFDCSDNLRACSLSVVFRLLFWILVPAVFVHGADPIDRREPATKPGLQDFSVPLQPGEGGQPGFSLVRASASGVDFKNILAGDAFLMDAVAHNGSGVALGDVDGDGRVDIYFCALQGANRLYLNQGNWRFAESRQSSIACAEQRSTSAVFADVDGDGDLDLLVGGIAAGTRLFLNDGHGLFLETVEAGLSKTASATSMALADLDGDGDLDLYCAHYIDEMHIADPTTHYALARRNGQYVVTHVNGEPATSPRLRNRFVVSSTGRLRELPETDGLYLNDGNGRFQAVQFEPGRFLDEQGVPMAAPRDWSLSVMCRDLNGDGSPDIYVCTDNATPDRVWINSGKATFRALDPLKLRHSSRSSMGIDFADINRDGLDDFIVVDMFSSDHARRMTQLVKQHSSLETVQQIDARPRYNRNTLFLGRPDGSYVETALMAGVAATEWSWGPVFLDVDLDGYEDLLVTNGFSFDVMDQDSHDQLRAMELSKEQRQRSRQFHPPLPTANAAFRNRGDGTFESQGAEWGFEQKGVSYGMALADLDNDGDLDVLINQLNEDALMLRNRTSAPRVKVVLEGLPPNTRGVGARIRLVIGDLIQSQTIDAGGRYLSGDEAVRVFAFPDRGARSAHLEVSWPDGRRSEVQSVQPNRMVTVRQSTATVAAPESVVRPTPMFLDASSMVSPANRDSVPAVGIPEVGPDRNEAAVAGVSWFDINGDGWEDLWIAGGSSHRPAGFLNAEGVRLQAIPSVPSFPDSLGATVGWNNGLRQNFWLSAASHRSSHPGRESAVVVFDVRSGGAPQLIETGPEGIGALCAGDVDGDGDLDLFIGGTPVFGRYPEPARSQIWINDGGTLKHSASWSNAFRQLGIVRGATFHDVDGEGSPDLAMAMEWGPIRVFRNAGDRFQEITHDLGLDAWPGLWTGIATGDFDADGRLDLVVGNRGLNTALAVHQTDRFSIWFGDPDHDGVLESFEAWRQGDDWMPVSDRTTLARVIPDLEKRIPTHQQFGRSTVAEFLGPQFKDYGQFTVSCLESSVFLNRPGGFVRKPLPREAQWSPTFSVNVADADADGNEDLFLAQNEFPSTLDITRNDGGQGLWLAGRGDGTFTALDSGMSGVDLSGEQRGSAVSDFNHDGRVDLVVSQKQGKPRLYRNQSKQRGYRVTLQGPDLNPGLIGAGVRMSYKDGTFGPLRMIRAGSGGGSQDAAVQVMGWKSVPKAMEIRLPNGARDVHAVEEGQWDLKIRIK